MVGSRKTSLAAITGSVNSINVKAYEEGERGLPKRSVGTATVRLRGIDGDFNRHRVEERGGDLDRALLLLPLATIKQLNEEGWDEIAPGDLGENITTLGISYKEFVPGNIYRIGDYVEIEITEKCDPCGNLSLVPGVGTERVHEFVRTMIDRRGWYAKVLEEGQIKEGDEIAELYYD